MQASFDISIIGSGVSSVFLAYTLMKKNENLQINIIDIGKELSQRMCGLDSGGICTCEGTCTKYVGFAGLGKSEGKFNYTNDFGGELGRKIGEEKTLDLMREVDTILCKFGGDVVHKYSTKNESLSLKARAHNLEVLSTEVRHLGTRLAKNIFQHMYEVMKNSITFSFETNVHSIIRRENGFLLHTNKGNYTTNRLVIGTGMSGSKWLKEQTDCLGLLPGETRLDLGIRIEMKGDQLQSILGDTFETKLKYEGESFSATTYCMNPNGRIIRKYQHGLVMPDGQNVFEKDTPSKNLNFTLFVPQYFPTYSKSSAYAQSVIAGINQGQERIVVQRLEDFQLNRKTSNLNYNYISPSIDAEYGNLHDEIPTLYTVALEKFLNSLESLIGEKINKDTLLYGVDAKFYEPKLYTNEFFETKIPNLHLIGDCSGETHSLSQAAASGVYLGHYLASQLCR